VFVLFLRRGTRDVFRAKILSELFFLNISINIMVDWWLAVTFHHNTVNLPALPPFVSSNIIYVIKNDGRG
jgi:hypothetical protein